MKSILLFAAAAILLLGCAVLQNPPQPEVPAHPRWLAHRGVHQTFDLSGVDDSSCTATRIRPTEHGTLENTLVSMRAAFDKGATAVELDLHGTSDRRLVVFHDASLACRTNGSGAPEDHTLAELQTLDIGYGYTSDGTTFPLRGTGVGAMPSLEQVLDAFPTEFLVLHLKSGRPEDGRRLAEALRSLPAERRQDLLVYGNVSAFREEDPGVRTFDAARMKSCLIRSFLGGGLITPDVCRDTAVFVPVDKARWLPGWPTRFVDRMKSVNTEVILVGPWHGHTEGLNDPSMPLPAGYTGWVWTDRIEILAP